MSSQVDGSISLGVELVDGDIDAQAKKIGDKIQKQIEKSLSSFDYLKFVKVPKLEQGAGTTTGNIYGKEFIDAFSKMVSRGNIDVAKSFQGAYVKVLATEGEKGANQFIQKFESILENRGSGVALNFSKSLSASIGVGATRSASNFAENFERGLNGIIPRVATNFGKDFERILSKTDPGTAKLFAKIYEDAAKGSTDAANKFSSNFQAILDRNGSKIASEYAKGFGLAFAKQGQVSAEKYSDAFREKLRRESFEAKVEIKTPKTDFNSVLAGSNASTAKLFSSIYKEVASTSEKAANDFSRMFRSVLEGSSPQIASEFAKGFQAAFKEGGKESAGVYVRSFKERFEESMKDLQKGTKTTIQAPTIPKEFNKSFGNVLASSDVGTAKLFSSVYKEMNGVSGTVAEAFSKNFERILANNGPKVAKAYAGGFQASFRQGGLESADEFSRGFQIKLATESRQAAEKAANAIKTTLESPQIPQGFINAFSRVLNKAGASTAKEFSSTWNEIYTLVGEESANKFQKNFEYVLKKRGSGKAKEYAQDISAAYKNAGVDAGEKFSDNFKKYLKRDFSGIGKFMRDTLVSTLGNTFSAGILSIFNGIFATIRAGIQGVVGFVQDSIGKAVDLDRNLLSLKAVSGGSQGEIDNIKSSVLQTSRNTVAKPGELLEISTELSKAGVPLKDINADILKSIALMSQLTGEGAARTTEIVNQIQSQFNIPLEKTTETIDYMVAAANGAQTSISDLGQGISYASANARTLGVDFEQLTEMLALASNAGLEGSRGGTAIGNMLKDLGENAKLLSQLDIKVFDDTGKIRNFKNIIGEIKDTIKDLSEEDQYKFLSEIFDERGIRGVTALIAGLEEGNEKTAQLNEKLANFKGSLNEAGDIVNSSVGSKFDILVNKVDLIKTQFGEAFQPGLNALVDFGDQTAEYLLDNTDLFDSLNQMNQEFADYLAEHPEYAQMLAEIIGEIAGQLFTELLNGARSLLEYLEKNPTAVQDMFEGFKKFAGAVIDIIPKVAKLVELLYSAAVNLRLIQEDVNGVQDDPNGKHYFASGLYTAPQSNNGGSSAYHIDTKFSKDLPFDRVIAAMDSMAFAYEEQGRVIEFSNDAVGNQRYDPNDPNRGDLVKKAFGAHSHSMHSNWNSIDYYIPKKDKNRFHNNPDGTPSLDSGAGVEIMLPAFQGGRTEYATGGRYGNHALIYDESGKLIMKTGHGDDRKPLPKNRDSFSNDSNMAAVTGTQQRYGSSSGPVIRDGSGRVVSDYSGGSSSSRGVRSNEKSKVLVEKTGTRDESGLEKLLLTVLDRQGKAVYTSIVNSGDPTKQNKFASEGRSKAEVREPLEFGNYKIKPTIKSGLPGVGSNFMPIEPKFNTSRTALGIHYDEDRKFNPGSAGCLVFKTEKEFNEFQKYLRANGITDFEFRDGAQYTKSMAARQSSRASAGASRTPQVSLPSGLTNEGRSLGQKYLNNPRIRAFLDAVSAAEGTNKGSKGGYNIGFGGGENVNLNSNHPHYGRELTPSGSSSASGRYQAMGHVWKEEAGKLGLKKMDPTSQDIFALGRLKFRDYDAKGGLSNAFSPGLLNKIATTDPSKFSQRDWSAIAHEWASVSPGNGAASAYSGQGTSSGTQSAFMANYRKSLKSAKTSPDVYSGTRTRFGDPRLPNQNVQDLIGLSGDSSTELDKLRDKRDKEIAKMIAEQEKQIKKEKDELRKNTDEALKNKRQVSKEARDLEKRTLQTNIEKNSVQFENTPLAESYKIASQKTLKTFDSETELIDAKIILEDINKQIKDIEENRSDENGIKLVVDSLNERKKAITENIEEIKKLQAAELEGISAQFDAKLSLEQRKLAEDELKKAVERRLKLQELEQKKQLDSVQDGDIRSVLENTFKLGNIDAEKQSKTLPITQEITYLEEQLKLAKDSGLDFGVAVENMQAKLNSLKADLESINSEFKVTAETIEESSRRILESKLRDSSENTFNSRSANLQRTGNGALDAELKMRKALREEEERFMRVSMDLVKIKDSNPEAFKRLSEDNRTQNINNTANILDIQGGYEDKLKDTRVETMKNRGDRFGAAQLEQDNAVLDESIRFTQEMDTIAQLQGKIPDDEMFRLLESAKEINALNLENISTQFETLGNVIKNVAKESLSTFVKSAITDFDNIGEHFNTLLDNMLSQLLDFAIQQAMMGIFNPGGLFGGSKAAKGAEHQDAGIGGILGAILPGFSKGGMTHSSGITGVDNMLAMLAPNEMVLSAEKVRQLSSIKPELDLSSIDAAKSQANTNVNGGNNITTIVNIDGNGGVQTNSQGVGDTMGKEIEKAVVGIVLRMQNTPGGALYGK